MFNTKLIITLLLSKYEQNIRICLFHSQFYFFRSALLPYLFIVEIAQNHKIMLNIKEAIFCISYFTWLHWNHVDYYYYFKINIFLPFASFVCVYICYRLKNFALDREEEKTNYFINGLNIQWIKHLCSNWLPICGNFNKNSSFHFNGFSVKNSVFKRIPTLLIYRARNSIEFSVCIWNS